MANMLFAGIPLDGSGTRPLDADLYGTEQGGIDAENISATGNLNMGNVLRYDEHAQRGWNGGINIDSGNAPSATPDIINNTFVPGIATGGLARPSGYTGGDTAFDDPFTHSNQQAVADSTQQNTTSGNQPDNNTQTTASTATSQTTTTTSASASDASHTSNGNNTYNTYNTTTNNTTNTTSTDGSSTGIVPDTLHTIDSTVSTLGNTVNNTAQDITNTAGNLVSTLTNTVDSSLSHTLSSVGGIASQLGGDVTNIASSLTNNIAAPVSDVSNVLHTAVNDISSITNSLTGGSGTSILNHITDLLPGSDGAPLIAANNSLLTQSLPHADGATLLNSNLGLLGQSSMSPNAASGSGLINLDASALSSPQQGSGATDGISLSLNTSHTSLPVDLPLNTVNIPLPATSSVSVLPAVLNNVPSLSSSLGSTLPDIHDPLTTVGPVGGGNTVAAIDSGVLFTGANAAIGGPSSSSGTGSTTGSAAPAHDTAHVATILHHLL